MKLEVVQKEDEGIRLDRWFKRHFQSFRMSELNKCLREKNIKVNGKKAECGYRVCEKDEILYPDTFGQNKPEKKALVSDKDRAWLQEMVIYKDRDILAINKPCGLAVQGGSGQVRFLDALLDGLDMGTGKRPKLVHRLDKDTSGVLVLARNQLAATWLTRLFKERDMHKTYLAVVSKRVKAGKGVINAPLKKAVVGGVEMVVVDKENGLPAVTEYEVLAAGDEASLIRFKPKTGRTHQIRAHAKYMGHPILGDVKYGKKDGLKLHLHALEIEIPEGERNIKISAPIPDYMKETISRFGLNQGDEK